MSGRFFDPWNNWSLWAKKATQIFIHTVQNDLASWAFLSDVKNPGVYAHIHKTAADLNIDIFP